MKRKRKVGRPIDLTPPSVLAERHPHGTRIRYICGCRCEACRRANTDYEKLRYRARKAGDWNGLVSSKRAQRHLEALSAHGVGRGTVADISGVARSVLHEVRAGRKATIRARTERLILAVTPDAMTDARLVDAAPTWVLIRALLREGFTKGELAVRLGYKTRALQLKTTRITARSAHRVARFYRAIMAEAA